jgi:3-oxoadipate enol-lactonase
MSALADDLARLLEALGIERVHYIGLSIGGMIGEAFALEHRGRLLSALWSDTLAASPKGGEAAWGERIRIVKEAKSVAPLADQTMERWFTAAFQPRRPVRWKEIRDTVAATSAQGYLGCTAAILDFAFTARLPALSLPVLVVCGAEDPGTPPAENRRLARLVPGARYEEIAGARHFVNVEREWAFNRIMMGWLARQRGQR